MLNFFKQYLKVENNLSNKDFIGNVEEVKLSLECILNPKC